MFICNLICTSYLIHKNVCALLPRTNVLGDNWRKNCQKLRFQKFFECTWLYYVFITSIWVDNLSPIHQKLSTTWPSLHTLIIILKLLLENSPRKKISFHSQKQLTQTKICITNIQSNSINEQIASQRHLMSVRSSSRLFSLFLLIILLGWILIFIFFSCVMGHH